MPTYLSVTEICRSADRSADVGLLGRLWPALAGRRVSRAVDHFTHVVFAIEGSFLKHVSAAERGLVDEAIQIVIRNVEAFLDTPAGQRSPKRARHLVSRVYQLRAAAEGIALGMAADPDRRPFGWQERLRQSGSTRT